MAEQEPATRQPAHVRWAQLLGLPDPEFTEEQRADYRRWMDEGNAQLEAVIARRRQTAA